MVPAVDALHIDGGGVDSGWGMSFISSNKISGVSPLPGGPGGPSGPGGPCGPGVNSKLSIRSCKLAIDSCKANIAAQKSP